MSAKRQCMGVNNTGKNKGKRCTKDLLDKPGNYCKWHKDQDPSVSFLVVDEAGEIKKVSKEAKPTHATMSDDETGSEADKNEETFVEDEDGELSLQDQGVEGSPKAKKRQQSFASPEIKSAKKAKEDTQETQETQETLKQTPQKAAAAGLTQEEQGQEEQERFLDLLNFERNEKGKFYLLTFDAKTNFEVFMNACYTHYAREFADDSSALGQVLGPPFEDWMKKIFTNRLVPTMQQVFALVNEKLVQELPAFVKKHLDKQDFAAAHSVKDTEFMITKQDGTKLSINDYILLTFEEGVENYMENLKKEKGLVENFERGAIDACETAQARTREVLAKLEAKELELAEKEAKLNKIMEQAQEKLDLLNNAVLRMVTSPQPPPSAVAARTQAVPPTPPLPPVAVPPTPVAAPAPVTTQPVVVAQPTPVARPTPVTTQPVVVAAPAPVAAAQPTPAAVAPAEVCGVCIGTGLSTLKKQGMSSCPVCKREL